MKKNQLWSILPSLLLSAALLGSCAQTGNGGNSINGANGTNNSGQANNGGTITDDSTVTTVPVDTTAHDYAFVSQDGDSYTYRCDDCGESNRDGQMRIGNSRVRKGRRQYPDPFGHDRG